ncbi:MAG: hypothetical protein ABSD75_02270 [Terriglobales bacterium]|jgi:hypothetical protein
MQKTLLRWALRGCPCKTLDSGQKRRTEQIYAKLGDFWLRLSKQSTSRIRPGGHGDFTIAYRDYKITAATTPNTLDKIAGYR